MKNIQKVSEILQKESHVNADSLGEAVRQVYTTETISGNDIVAIIDELDKAGISHDIQTQSYVDICDYDVATLGDIEITSEGNDQRTSYVVGDQDCADDAYADRQLTITSQYHDWHDTIADNFVEDVDRAEREYHDNEITGREYNEAIRKAKKELRESAKKLKSSWMDISDRVDKIIAKVTE